VKPLADNGAAGARQGGGMSSAMTLLFAFAGGAAVANLYWAQPLLATIAKEFAVSISSAGVLVTVTQVGYAVGILLVVPLGDVLDRRRLIPLVYVVCAVALLGVALAPSFPVLLIGSALVGLTTVAAQVLGPLASDLAAPAQRGRVVGAGVPPLSWTPDDRAGWPVGKDVCRCRRRRRIRWSSAERRSGC
jgi:predicted MFS family arabinose efflux permease